MNPIETAFDQKAAAWESYTQSPPGRLREDLSRDYLLPHLPPPPARILDAGCGTGNLGLGLAAQGYEVHLLDFSAQMLAIAQEKAKVRGLQERALHFHPQAIEVWTPPCAFEVILCHTLLEYVPEVPLVIAHLASYLAPGGLLSLVFVNHYAEPLSLALGKGQLRAALAAAKGEASAMADLFGVPRRLFSPQEILAELEQNKLNVVAEYGLRLLADYAPHLEWKEDAGVYTELFALEKALGANFPYRYLGRYGQMIAIKQKA
jgi:S-adenosylmethionine-dependent methyltransferase